MVADKISKKTKKSLKRFRDSSIDFFPRTVRTKTKRIYFVKAVAEKSPESGPEMVFESVKQLHENELWSNLISLAPFCISIIRSTANEATISSCKHNQQMLCLIADAFYETKEFCRAESLYKESLQLYYQTKKTSKSTKKNLRTSQRNGRLHGDLGHRHQV